MPLPGRGIAVAITPQLNTILASSEGHRQSGNQPRGQRHKGSTPHSKRQINDYAELVSTDPKTAL